MISELLENNVLSDIQLKRIFSAICNFCSNEFFSLRSFSEVGIIAKSNQIFWVRFSRCNDYIYEKYLNVFKLNGGDLAALMELPLFIVYKLKQGLEKLFELLIFLSLYSRSVCVKLAAHSVLPSENANLKCRFLVFYVRKL